MVGLGGLEPPASPLSGVRSNQLSYRPGGEPLKRFVRVCSANARSWRSALRVCSANSSCPNINLAGFCANGTQRSRSRRERQTIRVSARIGHRAGSGHPDSLLFPLRLAARIPLRLAARR